jgi:hypothetical protein
LRRAVAQAAARAGPAEWDGRSSAPAERKGSQWRRQTTARRRVACPICCVFVSLTKADCWLSGPAASVRNEQLGRRRADKSAPSVGCVLDHATGRPARGARATTSQTGSCAGRTLSCAAEAPPSRLLPMRLARDMDSRECPKSETGSQHDQRRRVVRWPLRATCAAC